MKVFTSLEEWKRLRPGLTGSLGLVPTMGFLHEGHLSLTRRAVAENDLSVVWIFVNPKQFGDGADLEAYPRDMERDLALLEAGRVDYVLAPPAGEVYPPDFQTLVTVEALSKPLEGAGRPGHFQGVATVVAKMISLTQPARAYFGQKDGQQCVVVRRMVADLSMLTEIVVCPTVRDADGLALSSRNVRLTPEQRRAAPVLHRALSAAQETIAAGERNADTVRLKMRAVLDAEPLAHTEYASLADAESLEECGTETGAVTGTVMASLAVRFGEVRLIDNVLIEVD
ncbi:MAG: pantoate--beta-alanine ligase [SAR324 cluster bacterium]|nr:pantoate--beta-alanine ligase [SAR324 cluster bacterium]